MLITPQKSPDQLMSNSAENLWDARAGFYTSENPGINSRGGISTAAVAASILRCQRASCTLARQTRKNQQANGICDC